MYKITVPTSEGFKEETVYTIRDFPYQDYMEVKEVRGKNTSYLNIPAAFDIETTNIETENPYAFMYHWQFCLGEAVIFGRTWNEYIEFLKVLKERLRLKAGRRLVVYIHNFSFEFAFMQSFFDFTEVFARTEKKPIKAVADCYEYRCSYFLSNMNLGKWCENCEGVTHYKLKGLKGYPDYDYDKYRTPSTVLTMEEKAYCYNDVRGLSECVNSYLTEYKITSIPLTSTGFVRRAYRTAMVKNKKNRAIFRKIRLTPLQYLMCKYAFRGGNTHANAWYTGEIIENMDSYDLQSSYPAAIMIDRYPMTKFLEISPKNIHKYLSDPNVAVLMTVRYRNIKHNIGYGIPYIDLAHCRTKKKIVNDNGRVLSAEEITMTITDIDYHIIKDHYTYEEIAVSKCFISRYGYLSEELRKELLEFFYNKSNLRGVVGKEYEYLKSKNKLNATFGCMVTDITQPEVVYEDGEWTTRDVNIEEALERYYKSYSSFLSYQHGIWVTANARKRLQDMIDKVGEKNVVYVDTDSIKCLPGHRQLFENMNKEIMKLVDAAPVRPEVEYEGKKFTMGLWDYEGSYDKFVTLGSKKYCVVKDGKLTVTVSGLNKKLGSAELTRSGGIEAFKVGKVFYNSGRLTAYYESLPVHEIQEGPDTFLTGGYVALVDTTYTLGVTNEYQEILNSVLTHKE